MEEESSTQKMIRISRDPKFRRDLLWLRAQEKEDSESLESLERADPDLRRRMEVLMAETRPDLMEDARERRDAFVRLWHQRYEMPE